MSEHCWQWVLVMRNGLEMYSMASFKCIPWPPSCFELCHLWLEVESLLKRIALLQRSNSRLVIFMYPYQHSGGLAKAPKSKLKCTINVSTEDLVKIFLIYDNSIQLLVCIVI